MAAPRRRLNRGRKPRSWRRWLVRLALAWLAATLLVTLPLRWLDPPTSAYIVREQLDVAVRHHWVPIDALPAYVPLAMVAAEDQNFPHHHGFDLGQIQEALAEGINGGRVRGASTISQQLARNLYLWPGERWWSRWLRKGLEGWFTGWLELGLSKRRILELYLNLVEFDRGVFGIEAAARHYFGIPAGRLDRRQAALLAAALPAPKRRDPGRPDAFLLGRQRWILDQMDNLGEAWVP